MFPSFLGKMWVTHGALSSSKWHLRQSSADPELITVCYSQFRIRQRLAQTTAEDATLMAKALQLLPTF